MAGHRHWNELLRAMARFGVMCLAAGVMAACDGGSGTGRTITPTPSATPTQPVQTAQPTQQPAGALSALVMVGYQGWYGCPGDDASGNLFWQHWFVGAIVPRSLTVDQLPDMQALPAKQLCNTGLLVRSGAPLLLYSAQNPQVVALRFEWMRAYGIDGAAVQRFVSETTDPVKRARSDTVLLNAMHAAQASGRVFYITYDVSGADAATVTDAIRTDWRHVVNDLKLTASTAYLRDRDRPVLQLWGFGFPDRPGDPALVSQLISDLHIGAGGLLAATLIGGVPEAWRTLGAGSKSDASWSQIYRSYDVISPWSVGSFDNDVNADAFLETFVIPDREETQRLGIEYLPVVFPGFSWHNLMHQRGTDRPLNEIPRNCGRFLWHQVTNLLSAGRTGIFVAMFDEMDEGTALLPTLADPNALPAGVEMVTPALDGCQIPDDWYLQVTGRAARAVHEGSQPPADLATAMRN